MKSLFAEVYVPALDLTLDLLIPCHITVNQAICLIADVIDKKEQVSLDKSTLALYDSEGRVMLAENISFDEAQVPDACSLVLV